MSDVFAMKRGDNLPLLKATLWEDAEKTDPVDLTNATEVKVKIGSSGSALNVDRAVTIVDPASGGKIETQITNAESGAMTPGDFDMEFEVTWNDGGISTYPKEGFLTFTINPDLDPAA